MNDNFESDDLTERRYKLTCKTKFVNGKYKGQAIRNVILIPQDNDQRTKFLMAWLPDITGEHYEIASFISMPVDSPCRVAIRRGPDEMSERHYLFVMSKGVEEQLLKMKEGSTIAVETYKASEESETDHAIGEEGSFEVQQ